MTNLVTRGLGKSGQFFATSGLGRALVIADDVQVRPYGDKWHDPLYWPHREDEEMIVLLRAFVEVITPWR